MWCSNFFIKNLRGFYRGFLMNNAFIIQYTNRLSRIRLEIIKLSKPNSLQFRYWETIAKGCDSISRIYWGLTESYSRLYHETFCDINASCSILLPVHRNIIPMYCANNFIAQVQNDISNIRINSKDLPNQWYYSQRQGQKKNLSGGTRDV